MAIEELPELYKQARATMQKELERNVRISTPQLDDRDRQHINDRVKESAKIGEMEQ
jgi:hypothetical protein